MNLEKIKEEILKLEKLKKIEEKRLWKKLFFFLTSKEKIINFIEENFEIFFYFYNCQIVTDEEAIYIADFIHPLYDKINFKGEKYFILLDLDINFNEVMTVSSESLGIKDLDAIAITKSYEGITDCHESYYRILEFNQLLNHIKSIIPDEEIADGLLSYDCSKCKYLTICKIEKPENNLFWKNCKRKQEGEND